MHGKNSPGESARLNGTQYKWEIKLGVLSTEISGFICYWNRKWSILTNKLPCDFWYTQRCLNNYEQNFPAVISTKKKSRIRIRVDFAFVSWRDAFPVIFFLLYIIFMKICYTCIYLLQTANNNCSNNSIQVGFFFLTPAQSHMVAGNF